ncbi:carboxypeptidase-like regulatory domain-containing protein [Muricauda sp. 334s03]|uniref:Carboxypeptidase-like regulatory domain-containing protein n=1 Tax=Flagellimonas yonaguniensis TaxID=3031325 RepID=A0ABT5XWW0_9FLAO|nr:carboxypeptidase-like regulatory domain-containing protein [[Muricauda] yonaguniensis]MDF0715573.1 carboxypeptidase-like regulatory domain-containing protein [[Muricauda] yonaguniensis]
MRKCLFVLVIFATQWAFAQEWDSKILQGRVTSTDKDVVGVVVQNTTTRDAVITDLEGNFSIRVRVNDTLVFSAVHFLRKSLPVTQALYQSSFVEVPMQEFVNQLREVVVSPYDLTGDLAKDIDRVTLEQDVSAEALNLPNAHQHIPTQSERRLEQATAGKFNVGMLLNPPIDPLINAITGRTKMLKKRVEVDKTYAQTQQVQGFYADSLFVSTLKIPMQKINDFMYFCEVDEAFQAAVESQDKLRIWDIMLQKSRAYRENNDLD